ncbi:exonuclease SbcCD subunit D [uncultured Selenomonas sp.]|uniref:exonuclease SbcCD subunit D n=1 Tax=uncultured Selenomonas sp. TaxID=159275 RepID=UPI0028F0B7DC|nr:exonuclease SbcCD subunit D [uncultured Selenomonas sp.]
MRFIHTADWHLGRLFFGRHLTDDQAHVLDELVHLARDARVEAVVIAGDIYDRAVPPVEAVELFDEVLSRLLLEEKLKVLYIAGNHDSAARLGFGSRLLAGGGVFVAGQLQADAAPVVLDDAHGKVAFSLLPYMEPATVRFAYGEAAEDLAGFDEATSFAVARAAALVPEGCRSVAVAHAFIAGGASSDSERPLSVGGSDSVSPACFAPFSYTALGHLHAPQQAGAANIRYAGSLMKYSFSEVGQRKGATVVDLAADGTVSVEEVLLAAPHDLAVLRGTLEEILKDRERFPKSEDYIAVELMDKGPVLDAHGKLSRIYPNVLQVTRPGLMEQAGALREQGRKKLERPDDVLFGEFFADMTGETLDEPQKKELFDVLEELLREEREAKI